MDLYDKRTALMRLHGSIIRIGGDPVHIDNIEHLAAHTFRLQYHLLGNGKFHIIQWGDEAINYKPVDLGYVNYRNTVILVERLPMRQWKLGLCRSNCKIMTWHNQRVVEPGRILDSKAMSATIKGKFPSVTKVKRDFDDKPVGAISRDFLLRTDGKLYHRHCGVVGRCSPNIKLHDKYFFLQEQLETAI